jgi:DNA-binding response OmpR family regulator
MQHLINNIEAAIKNTTDVNTAKELQSIIDSWNLTVGLLKGIILDTKTKSISIDGTSHTLTKQEFLTLKLLSETNHPLGRQEILENAWEFKYVGPRTVDVHIRKLRKKLGNDFIQTRKGLGYSINQSITIK